ncbi:rho GTPase-activating protein 32-like, partial [Amphibalanus amphitrite]|uniref:rho GTPase-activating protein 32-like n=1 Tax=Amphibalanus amphitrite TaxID=1232801 RepID=UPI001C926FCC
MSVSAPASWSKSQNPYRTAPARRHRRHLVSLRDVRSQTPCLGERSGLAALAAAPVTTAASPPSTATTPLCRRARELSDIDPKYVSQSGLCLSSDMETSRGSIRIQHLTGTRPPVGEPRFPKLEECAHFHYEVVELGPLLVQLYDEELKWSSHAPDEEAASYLSLQVTSFGRSWVLRRTYDNLRLLDTQLHQCVYDRKYSCLPELPLEENLAPIDDSLQVCFAGGWAPVTGRREAVEALVADYLQRFSQIAGPLINCAPILNWFELDNRGNRLLVADDSDINTPAVAAALVGKRYVAQASDEISLEVGDMISVIDMAPPDESVWWRGKRGFEVGFFPCECVELIGEKVPSQLAEVAARPRRSATLQQQPSRPVLRKHGKLIAFFRSFIQTRPSRRKLKQSGILKERVFGCDLGEHLMNTGRDIPVVLRSCAEFIEAHGIVDGIYRLSGVNSNIQRLRNTFDEDRVPDLADPSVRQDIHSVSCLLKQYLRELPNPLLTYQLYDKFVSAVQSGDDQRLLRMRDVVQQLPPPHYRTLEYLIRHLSRVSAHGHSTGMTPKNLAIVWAPNLVRSKELEVGGVAALQGVGIQAVVVEYLIRYCELIFSDKLPAFCPELAPQTRTPKRSRPKSLAISTPTKLLSLEEARSRALGVSAKADQKYIEVGGGPSQLPTKYHTVIELPQRKTGSLKLGRSPLGWKSLFRGRPAKAHQRKGSEPIDIGLTDKTLTESDLTQGRMRTRRLRSVKSADSLVSLCHAESQRGSMLLDASPSPVTLPASAPAAEPAALRSCSESDTTEAAEPAVRAHARSVSHDSYFNSLLELKLPFCDAEERLEEEEEELHTQYCFDDSDMRVFSEDETMRASDSAGWRGRIRQLTSPPRVRRAARSEDGAVKRAASGSFRDKVLSALSPGARRRAEEAAAEAGGSPRVKVRKKASVETLTCSESTSVDVSSLRTDGSVGGALSEGGTPPAAPAPAAAAAVPAGRQVVAEVHVSPEPSTCQDIILLSPISECTASSAEQYVRQSVSSPADDVTERDVSEIADSDGALTPAADANRLSTLVPEALELLDRRLNSESFRRAVADAAAGGADADDTYENISPVGPADERTPHAEHGDDCYEPVSFGAPGGDGAGAAVYENAAFASAAEVWQPRSAPAPAADGDGGELVYENVSPPAPDAVYQQVRVFRDSLQQVNALAGRPAAPARRSFVEPGDSAAAAGCSPTRSCPTFSDGSPSPTDVRYSQLSSAASSPDRLPGSADLTTAATCSDTLDERPLPSEAERCPPPDGRQSPASDGADDQPRLGAAAGLESDLTASAAAGGSEEGGLTSSGAAAEAGTTLSGAAADDGLISGAPAEVGPTPAIAPAEDGLTVSGAAAEDGPTPAGAAPPELQGRLESSVAEEPVSLVTGEPVSEDATVDDLLEELGSELTAEACADLMVAAAGRECAVGGTDAAPPPAGTEGVPPPESRVSGEVSDGGGPGSDQESPDAPTPDRESAQLDLTGHGVSLGPEEVSALADLLRGDCAAPPEDLLSPSPLPPPPADENGAEGSDASGTESVESPADGATPPRPAGDSGLGSPEGGLRAGEPAPAWLRSDLRRLSDRRASVRQLLSKFELKEEGDGAEEGYELVGPAGEAPATGGQPDREPVSRKTSLPERPRYLFSPKPFQRQLSDQTAARARPEGSRVSPLVSPVSGAALRITENPLHAATERLARSAAEPARPLDGLRGGSVPTHQPRVGCLPSRPGDAEPAPAGGQLDATARERIERYKQERRSALRQKFNTESFKREKTEVMQELRRPAGVDPQSPSPTRRQRELLRRSDSEAAVSPSASVNDRLAAAREKVSRFRSQEGSAARGRPAAAAAPVRDPTEDVNVRQQ